MIDGLGRRADGGTAERLPRRWPQYLSNRTGSGPIRWGAALDQGTKSLRDSPLRGGLPARAVTKGEIVDSGRRALS
jgi:hypothetical protein